MRGKYKGENDRAQMLGRCGNEWWGNRPFSMFPVNTRPKTKRRIKQMLSGIERMQSKKTLLDYL